MMLSINEIQIGKRLRGLREAAVTELMESINRLGLRTPITVSSRPAKREGGGMDTVAFDLVAGQHRLEACKRLGWEEIEASIVQMSDDERELWEIDENLCRAEFSELERGEHLARRKTLYEAMHPQTKRGANREPSGQFGQTVAPRFSEDTAEKTGTADTTIRRAIRRVVKIDEKVRDRIRDNPEIADSGVELDALASLDTQQQREAVSLVENGKAAGIREAKRLIEPKAPLSKEAQIRALREREAVPSIGKSDRQRESLKQLLRVLRSNPNQIAGFALDTRVDFALACLAVLNVSLEDLRAP